MNENRKPAGEKGKTDLEPARRYREKVVKHDQTSDTQEEAEKARRDLEGPEGDELRRAEDAGRERTAEEDPELEGVSTRLKDRERER